MLEIVGSLALITLFLMAAIKGIQWSSDKLKSNLLKDDVLQRGADIKNQMDHSRKIISLKKWDMTGKAGYPIYQEATTVGIRVDNVPGRVCQMTFDALIGLAQIKVNEVIYALPQPQICVDTNTMVFYFDEDKTYAIAGETNTCDPECTEGKVCVQGKCVCPKGTTEQGDQCIKECDECYELDKESGTCQPVVSTGECCTYHGFLWEDGSCKTHCDEGERVCSLGSSTWCCAEGRYCGAFEGQCCIGETCCPNHQNPYCANGTYDTTCTTEQCCTGKLTRLSDGTDICCEAGQTPYCYRYNFDGTCSSTKCCSGTAGHFNGADICCSSGQTPYCASYNRSDETCLYATCCSGTIKQYNGMDVCCSSANQTTYCSSYRSDGTCQSASCCSGTIQKYNGMDVCSSSSNCTPYCLFYNSDGTCQSASCCSGTIKQYNGMNVCCSSSDGTPYCSSYKSDGTCSHAQCCSSGQTPYCYRYNSDGTCSRDYCCSGTVFQIDGKDTCCASGSTAYCASYNVQDGSCTSMACCADTVTKDEHGRDVCEESAEE